MADNAKLREILSQIQKTNQQGVAKTPSSSVQTTVDPLTGLQRQTANLADRLSVAGADVEDDLDTRNFVEKALNLTEDQNVLFDIFEVLGRPQRAIQSAVEELTDPQARQKDVGGAFMAGLTGENKDASFGQVLRNVAMGGKEEDGTLDWTDVVGLVADMVFDPADLALIPVTGGLSYLATNAPDVAKVAKAVAKGADEAVDVAKGVAKGVDFVVDSAGTATKVADTVADAVKAGAEVAKKAEKISMTGFVFKNLGMGVKGTVGVADTALEAFLKSADNTGALSKSYQLMKKQSSEALKKTGVKLQRISSKALARRDAGQLELDTVRKNLMAYFEAKSLELGVDKDVLAKQAMNIYEYMKIANEPITVRQLLTRIGEEKSKILAYDPETASILRQFFGDDYDRLVKEVVMNEGSVGERIGVFEFNPQVFTPEGIEQYMFSKKTLVPQLNLNNTVDDVKGTENTIIPKRSATEMSSYTKRGFEKDDPILNLAFKLFDDGLVQTRAKVDNLTKSLAKTFGEKEDKILEYARNIDNQFFMEVDSMVKAINRGNMADSDKLIRTILDPANKKAFPPALIKEAQDIKNYAGDTILYNGKTFSKGGAYTLDEAVERIYHDKDNAKYSNFTLKHKGDKRTPFFRGSDAIKRQNKVSVRKRGQFGEVPVKQQEAIKAFFVKAGLTEKQAEALFPFTRGTVTKQNTLTDALAKKWNDTIEATFKLKDAPLARYEKTLKNLSLDDLETLNGYIALKNFSDEFGHFHTTDSLYKMPFMKEIEAWIAKDPNISLAMDITEREGGNLYENLEKLIKNKIKSNVTVIDKNAVTKELNKKVGSMLDLTKSKVRSVRGENIMKSGKVLPNTTSGRVFTEGKVRYGNKHGLTYEQYLEEGNVPNKLRQDYTDIMSDSKQFPEIHVEISGVDSMSLETIPANVQSESDFVAYILSRFDGNTHAKYKALMADPATYDDGRKLLAEIASDMKVTYPRGDALDLLADKVDKYVKSRTSKGKYTVQLLDPEKRLKSVKAKPLPLTDPLDKVIAQGIETGRFNVQNMRTSYILDQLVTKNIDEVEAMRRLDGEFARGALSKAEYDEGAYYVKHRQAIEDARVQFNIYKKNPNTPITTAKAVKGKKPRLILDEKLQLGNFYTQNQIDEMNKLIQTNPIYAKMADDIEGFVKQTQEIIGKYEFDDANALKKGSMVGYIPHKRIEPKAKLLKEGGKAIADDVLETEADKVLRIVKEKITEIDDGTVSAMFLPGKTQQFADRLYKTSAQEANNIKSFYYKKVISEDDWFKNNVPDDWKDFVVDYMQSDLFELDVRSSITELMTDGFSAINYNHRTTDALLAMTFGNPENPDAYMKFIDDGVEVGKNYTQLTDDKILKLRKTIRETMKYAPDTPYVKELDKMLTKAVGNKSKKLMLENHLYNFVLTSDKNPNMALKALDTFTNFYKGLKVSSPAFNVRNTIGNPFNMYLSGLGMGDIARGYTLATKTSLEYPRLAELVKKSGIDSLSSADRKMFDIYTDFMEQGFLNRSYIYKLNDIEGFDPVFKGLQKGEKADVTNPMKYAMEKNMELNLAVDTHSRMALYAHALDNPEYIQKLGIPLTGNIKEDAMNAVRLVLFDPHDLTFFEQDVMKRLIPFYTFTRQNLAFQMKNLTNNSDRYYRSYKLLQKTWEGAGIEWDDLKDYERNQMYVPLPFFKKEDGEYVALRANVPMSDLFEFISDPLQRTISATTPLMKAPFEAVTNTQTFTGMPIENFRNEPSKNIPFLSKKAEWGLGQVGLDVPAKVSTGIATAGAGLVKGDMEMAGKGVSQFMNLTSEGSVAKNRLAKEYEKLDRLNDTLKFYKAKGADVMTVAEISETGTTAKYDAKQAELNRIKKLVDKYRKR